MAGISDKALKASYGGNKYKFNGMEQDLDLGVDIYEAFYRNLDPQLGRFWQIDPITMRNETPYSAMQNNPIIKRDWLGDYFTWGNFMVYDRYKRLRRENNAKMASYISELSSLDLNSSDKDVQKQITGLTALINMHGQLNEQWNEMESSGIEFYVTDEKPKNADAGGLTNFKENRVNIQLGADDTRNGLQMMAHEFRHGYGYISGELMEGNLLYDMTDEVAAYNAGFLFLDRGTANLVAEGFYDVNWFKKTQLGTRLYSQLNGKEVSLTINTPVATVMRYYSNGRISALLNSNKNNSNLTMKQALDKLNNFSKQRPPEFRYGELLSQFQ